MDRLAEAGGRRTASRQAIIEVIVEAGQPPHRGRDRPTRCTTRFPSVNLSTVYRTLDALTDLGIVDHVHFGHGRAVYHRTDEAHQHLVCEQCGAVEEFPVVPSPRRSSRCSTATSASRSTGATSPSSAAAGAAVSPDSSGGHGLARRRHCCSPPTRGARPSAIRARARRTKTLTAATVVPVCASRMFSSTHTHAVSPATSARSSVRMNWSSLAVLEQGEERRRHLGPATERGPSRMGARGPVGVLPHLRHGVEVARLERLVEGPVDRFDRILVAHRCGAG